MGRPTKMRALPASSPVDVLAENLETTLMREYGPVLTGDSLRRVLGYRSPESLRQAISRGTVPIPLFSIENRRGKFALTKNVARWLAERAIGSSARETPKNRDEEVISVT